MEEVLFALPFRLSALLIFGMLIWGLSQKYSVAKYPFCLIIAAMFIYSFGYALETTVSQLSWHYFWIKFQYVGIVSIPVFLLIFSLVITGRQKYLTRGNLICISLFPALILIIVFTIDYHELYYRNVVLLSQNRISTISFDWGLFYVLWIAYQNIIYLLCFLLLLESAIKGSIKKRGAMLIMMTGMTIPWFTHLIYLTGIVPQSIDIIPMSFTVTAFILLSGFEYYKIFDMLPVAKAQLFDILPDVFLLIDIQGKIMGFNRSAQKLFRLKDRDTGSTINLLIAKSSPPIKNGTTTNSENADNQDSVRKITEIVNKTISDVIQENTPAESNSASVHNRFSAYASISSQEDNSGPDTSIVSFTHTEEGEQKIKWYRISTTLLSESGIRLKNAQDSDVWGLVLSLTDITLQKESEDKLRRLALAIDHIGETIVITDVKANILYVNPAFEFTTGYRKDEAIGENPRILQSGKHDAAFYQEMWKQLQNGLPWYGRITNKKKSGMLYTEEAAITPIIHNGIIQNYVAVKRDISDLLVIQQEVDRLILAVEQIDNAVIVTNLEGIVQYANSAFERISGYLREDVAGKHISQVKKDENVPDLNENMWKRVSQGQVWNGTYHLKNKAGGYYYLESTVSPVYNSFSDKIGYVAIDKDITKEKEDEERLRESEEKYRAIAETTFVGILMVDTEDKISYINQALASMLGQERISFIQKTLNVIFDVNTIDQINNELLKKYPYTGESYETKITAASGKHISVLLSVSLLLSAKGVKKGFIGIVLDVTEREQALNAIKESARIKSNFVSMVSHELKIPLTVIKEGVLILTEGIAGDVNIEQKQLLTSVGNNVDRLSRLISDVLDFQKIEAGKMTYSFVEADINEVVTETIEMMVSVITKKGLSIKSELYEPMPLIDFDRDKIIQVLVNVIGNSIRFTERGGISIKTKLHTKNQQVEIIVNDTGMGISKELLPKIFEGFFNISTNHDQHFTGGTGLGLPISKQIIEAHNGTINISSEKKTGTTVSILLPLFTRN